MKVIEFLGMPRAGKTTQIKKAEEHLLSQGKKVSVLWDRERALEFATPPDQPMAYQLVFFSRVVEEYYRALKEGMDYFIIDRGFQDALIWADVLRFVGVFSQEQSAADKACFQDFIHLVDQTFYFSLPIDIGL